MPKLTTRQILIIGVMLMAILYGAYELFSIGGKKPVVVATAKTAADLNAFIGDITATLAKDASSPVVDYMIKRAEMEWLHDPFYEPRNDREEAAAKEAARVEAAITTAKGQFNYTGYIDMGHKKIAVVNGNEYIVGEALDVGGFVLNDIYPVKIIIYNKENRFTLEIPLKE